MRAVDCERFLSAQTETYDGVRAELGAGRKRGHWMWFVFPQASGLGRSPTAQFYALGSLEDAGAYAAHPVLGTRLRESCALMLAVPGRSAVDILGTVDAMKLRSSMTMFHSVTPDEPVFGNMLDRFFGGAADGPTLTIMARWRSQADGSVGAEPPGSLEM